MLEQELVTEFEALILPLHVLSSQSLHGLLDIDITGPEAKLSVSTGQGMEEIYLREVTSREMNHLLSVVKTRVAISYVESQQDEGEKKIFISMHFLNQ